MIAARVTSIRSARSDNLCECGSVRHSHGPFSSVDTRQVELPRYARFPATRAVVGWPGKPPGNACRSVGWQGPGGDGVPRACVALGVPDWLAQATMKTKAARSPVRVAARLIVLKAFTYVLQRPLALRSDPSGRPSTAIDQVPLANLR